MGLRFEVERHINADPQAIWDLLTDAESYATWNQAVVSITGPIVEGNRIELVSVVNPKRTFKLRVSEMRAPNRMVWSDGMPLGLFKGERTYDVTPTPDGATFSMVEEFSGVLAPLITKAIPDMTDSFNQFAEGLKEAAEAA